MKELFNFCPVHDMDKEVATYKGNLAGYLADNKLDGVELFVYDDKPFAVDYTKEAVGVHLKFWPCWLDLWLDNKEALAE